MSRYDGLIIPRSYSEYINKTDAATLQQALQLSGVMDSTPTNNSNKPITSGGVFGVNKLVLEQTINLASGDNTITFQTNNAYLLVATGSNYGQGICFVVQGWSRTVLKGVIMSNSINFGTSDYSANKTMIVKNNGAGSIPLYIYRIKV